MSRIGKLPIPIPEGVTVSVEQGNDVIVKGKNGELEAKFDPALTIEETDGHIVITRPNDLKRTRAMHGLTRALLHNMVVGVSQGFEKTLEIVGVGYRAQLQGKKLVLSMGFSHPVEREAPEGITFEVPNPNTIIIKGINKQQVGQVAADIRAIRPPEPYKGKGLRYKDEYVRRKVGKTGM